MAIETWTPVQNLSIDYMVCFFCSFFFNLSEELSSYSVLLTTADAIPYRPPFFLQIHACLLLFPYHYLQMRMIVFSHPVDTINIYLPHSQILLIT